MTYRMLLLAIMGAVFALDRVTKRLIEQNVSTWESHDIVPHFFSIVHTRNRGAAFGILADLNAEWQGLLLIGLSLLVLGFVSWMLWNSLRPGAGESRALQIALSLVLGGALGNMYDRVVTGSVVDFLLFYVGRYQWPAFNLADTAISTGAGLLVLDLWRNRRAAAQA